jgi:hypothetical protein
MSAEDRKEILDAAAACVLRDRNATHGEAEDNFATIAALWTAYLRGAGILPKDRLIRSADVAILSALIKVGRLAQSHEHIDNWVDAVGYFACGGGIVKHDARSQEREE